MIKDDQVTSPKHEGLRDAQQNISLPFFHLKRKRLAVVEIAISRESKLKLNVGGPRSAGGKLEESG